VQVLKRAHQELFRRAPDECFRTFDDLAGHCRAEMGRALDRWHPPRAIKPRGGGRLTLEVNGDGEFGLNDWSFGQVCQLAKVGKETVNRLAPATAAQVLTETLPGGNRPLQVFTDGPLVRSVHGVGYTRLFNADLRDAVREVAPDFTPPQEAGSGGTGLNCGEQDLFAFLIDPAGWTEIDGEAFAPGFFVWNSEVGRRSVGVQTFWFQAVCGNHIVWDAVEVVEVVRKHTAGVGEALTEVRGAVEALVRTRDARRDGFVKAVRKAMETRIGEDTEEAEKVLAKAGIGKLLGSKALEMARQKGRFTVFAVVDALTRLAGELKNAGERTEADVKAARLLDLVVPQRPSPKAALAA
ncbi:MAG: hypothetical protein K2V38_28495, partial [Gemmataceae bacterium]|nr:hypothetical protein [Gemmataceae bacterium]